MSKAASLCQSPFGSLSQIGQRRTTTAGRHTDLESAEGPAVSSPLPGLVPLPSPKWSVKWSSSPFQSQVFGGTGQKHNAKEATFDMTAKLQPGFWMHRNKWQFTFLNVIGWNTNIQWAATLRTNSNAISFQRYQKSWKLISWRLYSLLSKIYWWFMHSFLSFVVHTHRQTCDQWWNQYPQLCSIGHETRRSKDVTMIWDS